MSELWFRKLGFSRNPFSIKPAAFSYELVGVNIDDVLSGIENGRVVFVEAPLGYGKTTLLKHIIHHFGGRGKVVYAHAVPSEGISVKGLLQRSSIANYITGTLPKGMILVVDEAQNILPDSSAEVAEFYKSGNLKAVVLFGTSYSRAKGCLVGELCNVMNGNVIRLSKPTPEQAISLVRGRIGNLPVLSNDAILAAYSKAQGSPRMLLQVCEDLCRAAVDNNRLSASGEEPSKVFVEKPRQKLRRRMGARRVKQKKAPRSLRASAKARIPALAAASVSSISSTAATPSVAATADANKIAVAKPKANSVVKMKAKASTRKKQVKKAKSEAKQQPSKPQPVSAHAEHTEHIEGDYWGEFMGMQK